MNLCLCGFVRVYLIRKTLKLVYELIYLNSSITSTEIDVNVQIRKIMDKLLTMMMIMMIMMIYTHMLFPMIIK